EAPKATLARRIYLDLTGLAPTPAQAAEFLADPRPDAWERLVDRLLASPHFGEKWARHWLDLARYSDSEGGVQDFFRPWAWRYREWVIDAFNRDLPFDRFTVEQVAGDLLPGAALEPKIATGFHRQTITSREGGIDLARLRFEQLVDRANTVGSVWLGLTVGCAQCHDHKYDPISQKDYYRLLAFFENSIEVDLDAPLAGETGGYRRTFREYRRKWQALLEEYGVPPLMADWEENLRQAGAHPGKRTDWDTGYDILGKIVDNGYRILRTPPAARTLRESDELTNHFARAYGTTSGKKRYEELRFKELDEKLTALAEEYPPLARVMMLAESPERQKTHVRLRGEYKALGPEVSPDTPAALPRLEAGAPPDRLALARWLVAKQNPLTARVAVNRIWQELFGKGLVRTPEDFGNQGEKPTHPELLDWLASDFIDGGWRIKRMVKQMVTSAAYRQSSAARPELMTRDPANTLLARQNRLRLPAELVRDSALQASGLLWPLVGGESIRPPQPEGIADLAYSLKWKETAGRARYRRGIYLHVQRTAQYPLLMNFDAPDRTVTCSRRENSNTPLQALNLLNDPVFTEAADALAARILEEGGGNQSERIDFAYQVALARKPDPGERDALASYLARRIKMARPESPAIPGFDSASPAEASAWFGAARVLLNLDEFLTRE
ncbi:MAG: DUF1553 domain-containing protein, partial [Acidobacteria bacterium]|nr:DUF1553 domain-containing protein [Acidobacteriota bacterium]